MSRESYEQEQSEADEELSTDCTYLTFVVNEEEYAIHVGHVTEIVRLQKIFPVPDVPTFVRGVINLRGKVIPLVDVRSRFGLQEAPYTDRTLVVVIEIEGSPTGLIVDGVRDVTEYLPAEISDAPTSATKGVNSLISHVGKRNERISMIVDVPVFVSSSSILNRTKQEHAHLAHS